MRREIPRLRSSMLRLEDSLSYVILSTLTGECVTKSSRWRRVFDVMGWLLVTAIWMDCDE
jgi:hypothetical protein